MNLPKKLVLYYILPLFTILKFPNPIDQPAYLEENDFNSKKRLFCIKKLGLQSPTGPLSHQSDQSNHEKALESNKPGLFKAPTPKALTLEALVLPLEIPGLDII